MALKPNLRLKIDELFMKWITDKAVQASLNSSLNQILRGEIVTYATPQALHDASSNSTHYRRTQSPSRTLAANRPASPSTPPCSPPPSKVTASPRSPRSRHRRSIARKDRLALSVSQSLVSEDGDASIKIPPFYYPLGRPNTNSEGGEPTLNLAKDYLKKHPDDKLKKEDMHAFAKAVGLPQYWGVLLHNATAAHSGNGFSVHSFINLWQGITSACHDDASRFMKLLAKHCKNWLEPEDFVPLIQDVVDTHPGLQFLQDAVDFHSRYIHCVISRIFYTVNTSWSGRITISDLRRSNLLQILVLLEEESDINQITDYFSYEHFYVIYCKFWELDKDHDLFIDKDDLARHNDHALSSRIIDRIFSGAVTRSKQGGKMSYTEFVVFLLSEEDKKTDKSIEYWFRCMDLDGDGYISMYEMEYFYEEQVQKMEDMGIDPLPFYDLLCQMLDLIGPVYMDKISLSDLKNCKQAHIFFDTMFNLEKYLDHEQRDPFSNMRDVELEGPEPSDWDKFASEEYELLVAEENATEEQDTNNSVEFGDYYDYIL
ncbi:serine/threonine-protein phosphatase 2A regulatory subunit B'' subunit beta-like isoform X2 [Watersipora subatra]|uniref:serine/threonine-protein phosphatase 2A regulatory subunit B'' subunit beta-like isoform X2 n=1 Tax=Watersipora subatra TaxID=2589382 RepID=UPI00355BF98F